LKAIAFSNRSYFGTLLYDDLLAVCKDAGTVTVEEQRVDLSKACAIFKSWDRHANLDSVGYPLATAWIENLLKETDFWAVPFSKHDPVNTPRGIRRNDAKVVEQVRSALARAVLKLEKNGIDPAKPWGQIQVYDVNGRRIPMHGGVGSGIYNLVGGDYSLFGSEAQDGLIHVRGGSSYIQVVAFDDSGPQAEAFLTYSQSTDPASPHFSDQAPRFAALDWIKLPFTDDEVRRDPQFATMTIEE
jgi:acyl-homoserine-lactone acylase